MLNLDPAKLLVIAVVAIILLGPDRLPQVARQVGAAWRSFNEFRHRMEAEVRSSMPDLPPTHEIARLARSPSALLDHLSNMSGSDPDAPDAPDAAAEPGEEGEPGQEGAAVEGGPTSEESEDVASESRGVPVTNGAVPDGTAIEPGLAPDQSGGANGHAPGTSVPEPARPGLRSTGAVPASPAPAPAPDVVTPGDPNLN